MSELTELYKEVAVCQRCELSKARTQTVPGEGPENAEIMFIGEAPGFHEDRQGRPFVGAAGKFLEELLASIGLTREEVYICNVVKCRPPENRNPLPQELAACQDYLAQQLEIINPKVICCLGKFACFLLLNQDLPITKLRGRFQNYRGIKVMPTFHPAYLLRNLSAKRLVWQDMQKVMAELKK